MPYLVLEPEPVQDLTTIGTPHSQGGSTLMVEILIRERPEEAPTTVHSMGYATLDDQTLYVQGGIIDANLTIINQFYSLNLSQTWDTQSPPWKALNEGSGSQQSPYDAAHSMIISKDKQNLIILGTTVVNSSVNVSTYNIASNSWSEVETVLVPNISQNLNGLAAASDPDTGLIYIPGAGSEGKFMLEFDPATKSSKFLTMPEAYSSHSVRFFTAVWSSVRKSILLYGGFYNSSGTDVALSDIYEYSPTTASWALVKTSGNGPDGSTSHCMVPAYNGSKMIVFGGILYSSYQSNLYILDVESMKWTRGTDIEQSLARLRMACSVSGDSFVSWGGYGGNNETSIQQLGKPAIYDLKANQWVNVFATVSPNPAHEPVYASKASRSTIIGSSAVAAIVVFVMGVFI
ncbi:hypothetical protein BGZ76_005900 [Entomortierella beljakovae]|nr:hypothetical protein BGZ76_005900 [Entomortierella beljakovae]